MVGDQLVMDLKMEQGPGRETQVQPPLEVWKQFFGVPDIYVDAPPSFRLIDRRATHTEEPTRPAVLHHHNMTIEIAGAKAPRPAIIRMVLTSPFVIEYTVYRPGMSNYAIHDALLDQVANPHRKGNERRWFIAPAVLGTGSRNRWELSATELQARVTSGLRDLAEEDEITSARDLLARLAGEPSEGQGYESHTPRRKAIENHAMTEAIKHFTDQGWDVSDVSATRSYDLHCVWETLVLHVEVKGTTSRGDSVLLTRNEVAHARGVYPDVALFVVAEINVTDDDPPVASGGRVYLHEPWDISKGELTALAFEYHRPASG